MYSMSYREACRLAAYIRRNAPGVEAIVLKTNERDPKFSPGVRGSTSHQEVTSSGPALRGT
jgi:hypothetical protein